MASLWFTLVAVLVSILYQGPQLARADAVPWSYGVHGTKGGPDTWKENYPDCGGVMQSPINVNPEQVVYGKDLAQFNLTDYKDKKGITLKLANKAGHTAEVEYSGTPVFIEGGSLPDRYKLDQFHFHWGGSDTAGSEHSVAGKHFPMEMHLVHHQEKLDNTTSAASHPYGLAVIAFFFKIGEQNDKFDILLDHFQFIEDPDQEVTLPTFALADLLPRTENLHYYRYYGSLTTPPCFETVIWTLVIEPITISEKQIAKFRGLYDESHEHIVDDYRPTQPLNERTVTTNDKRFMRDDDVNDGAESLQNVGFIRVVGCLLSGVVLRNWLRV